MVRCSSKNECQKDMCLKRLDWKCSKLLTILGSIVCITGGNLYDQLTRKRILFISIMSKFHLTNMSSKITRKKGNGLNLDLLVILY